MIKIKLGTGPKEEKKPKKSKQQATSAGDDADVAAPRIKVKKPRKKADANAGAPRVSLNLGGGGATPDAGMPRIRVKASRRPGDGYDSEAPDREDDPVIEEAVLFRMVPGEHLEYLRAACEHGDLSQVWVKFKDSRNAVVSIAGQMFAAKLVDLPTITEAHKSFDRKNIYKTADICQMLQVTVPIEHEDEAIAANEGVGQQIPHGITPPMHNVRKRRFRKRVSNKVIETVEAKVDELFRLDEEAEESQYELLHPNALNQPAVPVATPAAVVAGTTSSEPGTPFDMLGSTMEDDTQQVGGEGESSDENDALGLELERALGQDDSDEDMAGNSATGADGAKEDEDDEDDDDDDEDDDDDDDGGADMDENEAEAMHHNKMVKSEIEDLEQTIAQKTREAEATVNQIMRGRLLDVVSKLKQELEIKKKQLGTSSSSRDSAAAPSAPTGVAQANLADEADNEDISDEDDDDDDIEGLF